MQEGRTPAEFWEVEPEKIEQIYQFARELYEAGRYADASDVFLLLTALDPHTLDFWKGLGFASHQLNDAVSAAIAYENAIELDEQQAELYPYFIQVLIEAGRRDFAQIALKQLRRALLRLPLKSSRRFASRQNGLLLKIPEESKGEDNTMAQPGQMGPHFPRPLGNVAGITPPATPANAPKVKPPLYPPRKLPAGIQSNTNPKIGKGSACACSKRVNCA